MVCFCHCYSTSNTAHSHQETVRKQKKNIPAKVFDQSHDYTDRILSLISVKHWHFIKGKFHRAKDEVAKRQKKLMKFSLWWTRWPRLEKFSYLPFVWRKLVKMMTPPPKKKRKWKSWKPHPLIVCIFLIYIWYNYSLWVSWLKYWKTFFRLVGQIGVGVVFPYPFA